MCVEKTRKCTGVLCAMQAGCIDVEGCNLCEKCQEYFPVCETTEELISEIAKRPFLTQYHKNNVLHDFVLRGATNKILCNQMKWISVNEGLPEDCEGLYFSEDGVMRMTTVLVYNGTVKLSNRILVHNKCGYPDIEKTDGYVWSTFGNVTHWMPLPEPPKE